MRKVKAVEVIALAEDLLAELAKMQQLEGQIQRVQTPERIAKLVSTYPEVWHQFEREIQAFVIWLKALAVSLDA